MEGYLERDLLAGQSEAGAKLGEWQAVAHQASGTQIARAQQLPDGGLFRERPGVGTHQALLVFEKIVERESGGLAVAAVGEEHCRPTRTQRRQGGLGLGAAADTVEDRVGAAPVMARFARDVHQPWARRDRMIGPEREREALPVRARVDDHDPDSAAQGAEHKEMQQPHAAAAQDDSDPRGGAVAARTALRQERLEDASLAQAAQDAGCGLEEDRVEIVEMGGNPPRRAGNGTRPHQDLSGEAAGNEQILAESRTLGLAAAAAVEAGAAGRVVRNDESVARCEGIDIRASGEDLSHDLVSEHRSGRRRASRQFEEVGAAEPGPAQAQNQLAGTGERVGKLAPPRLSGSVDRDGAHGGVSFHQMERRIHRRFPRRIELRFWRLGETQGHTAYSTNISKSGLFLSSVSALMPGERLRLEIVDRDSGFIAEGRVARVHRVSLALRQFDQQGVGVRFLLPEELVENLVPLARQSGPVTQAGRTVEPEPLGPDDRWRDDTLTDEAAEALFQDGQPSDQEPAPKSGMDIARDKVVPVSFADPSTFLSTYHRDISAGGLFVSTPTPMALQEAIWIELQLPIAGERPKLFAARVIQRFDPQAAVGSGKNLLSGMAVQFVEPEKVIAELKPLLALLRR